MKKVKIITINKDGKIENDDLTLLDKIKKFFFRVLFWLVVIGAVFGAIYLTIIISTFLFVAAFFVGGLLYLWLKFGSNFRKK